MSSGKRRLRILDMLAGSGPDDVGTRRLCEVCAEVTNMTGAGIMLMSGEIPQGSVCATDEVSALMEDLQFALGEGPCVSAHQEDRPMLEPRLAGPHGRWPAFTPPAVDAGVAAVFAFPMLVGAVRLGALHVYRTEPGEITDDQHADALVMSSVAAQTVLALQSGAEPGQVAPAIEAGADFQYVVHQATGMVAAQLGVTVTEALVRLRAFAFGRERRLRDVAEDVVDRRLYFNHSPGGEATS